MSPAAARPATKTAPRKAAPKKAPAPRSLALAVQLYTLRDFLKTPEDVDATFKKIARIGYRNVQISGVGAELEPLALRALLDKHGLAAIGAHMGYSQMIEDFDATVDALHAWGCSHVAIPLIGAEFRKNAAGWKKTAKLFTALGKRLAAEGIVLQYHNHHFEFIRFAGQTGLELLYANSDPKYLQAEIDTAWVARGFQDPAAWILAMKGRSDQVHFKDTRIVDNEGWTKEEFAEIGNGNLDWPAIIAACRKVKVKDVIIEQDGDWLGGDPFKSLAASHAFLSKAGLR